MSKPILALSVLQLIQQGRLDLDTPLTTYLGHDYLRDQPAQDLITARMALTHRTGLPNWRVGYDEMGGPLPLLFSPGSDYSYSGEGMLFLQRALEAITGTTLDRFAQQGLFAPLGLRHTSYVWTPAIEQNLASGHREDGSFKDRTRYRKANGAYSLYTTPTEYAELMLTLMRPETPRATRRSPRQASNCCCSGRSVSMMATPLRDPAWLDPSPPTGRSAGAWTSAPKATSSSTRARTARASGRSASSIVTRARAWSSSPTATMARACAQRSWRRSATCKCAAATGRGAQPWIGRRAIVHYKAFLAHRRRPRDPYPRTCLTSFALLVEPVARHWRRQPAAEPRRLRHARSRSTTTTGSSRHDDLRLSRDGRQVAYVVDGQIFIVAP